VSGFFVFKTFFNIFSRINEKDNGKNLVKVIGRVKK